MRLKILSINTKFNLTLFASFTIYFKLKEINSSNDILLCAAETRS